MVKIHVLMGKTPTINWNAVGFMPPQKHFCVADSHQLNWYHAHNDATESHFSYAVSLFFTMWEHATKSLTFLIFVSLFWIFVSLF